MKKTVLALLLLVLAVPMTSAQTVIKYRRPMRPISIEAGASYNMVGNFDGRAKGGFFPAGGITFEGPMNYSLDIVLKLRYRNKNFVGVEKEGYSTPLEHRIHSICMDMGVNWYPFHQFWYMGAFFQFGGNVVAHRIDMDGSWHLVPGASEAHGMNALGLFLGFSVETGFSFSFWPIGDHFTIFGRYDRDFGCVFDKEYCKDFGLSNKMRAHAFSVGVRIPFSVIRD